MMRRFIVAFALVLALALPGPVLGRTLMEWTWEPGGYATVVGRSGTAACMYKAGAWVREIGKSGITAFKTKSELRGVYDIQGIMPSYGSFGYVYGPYFPDDARNFRHWFVAAVRGTGGTYALWAKLVGMRPSFWQKDVVLHVNLGQATCQSDGGGPLTPPIGSG